MSSIYKEAKYDPMFIMSVCEDGFKVEATKTHCGIVENLEFRFPDAISTMEFILGNWENTTDFEKMMQEEVNNE